MVVLNEYINFDMKILRKELSQDIGNFVRNSLEFYMKKEKIEKISQNVEKRIKNKFLDDRFVYITMKSDLCTHKFRKGKKEGYFCQKKIKTNLPEGSKKDFLCSSHSKLHIPKKRNSKSSSTIRSSLNHDKNKIPLIKGKNKKKKIMKFFLGTPCTLDFSKIFKNILN